ncbi:MAG: peptidylprolyl isomerase [Rhodobacterales bacterium]|nr:MAG: peptidylprolyl isomerase [Rhodobacterales bacterium]
MGNNKIARAFVWIIMALVLVGLIGFGSFNFGGSGHSIGKVGDTDISADRYYQNMRNALNAGGENGQRIPFSLAKMAGLDQQILEQVIREAAFSDAAAKAGISVGDAAVAERLRAIPAFNGTKGSFDAETYAFVLEQSGLRAADFEADLRTDISRSILEGAVTAGITPPAAFSETIYSWARERRDFSWVAVNALALDAPVGTPEAGALEAFYAANPEAFTTPELKKLTYIWLDPEAEITRIEISDEQLRDSYEARRDEFQVPERRLVERLIFDDRGTAQAAADAIAAGDLSFEQVVEARGFALADTDLGDVTEADLGAAGAAVFALTEPGITGPLDSTFGPALFRVNAILAPQITSFEDARDTLHGDLAADAARRAVADKMIDLDDALAGGAELEDLVSEFGVSLGTLDWSGASDAPIAGYEAFRAAADAVSEADFPEMAELDDGGIFALRLDAVQAPELQPLDAVREEATALWRAEETQRQVLAKAEEIAATLNAGGALPEGLGPEKFEIEQPRTGFVEGLSPAVFEALFAAETGQWTSIATREGAVLFKVATVRAPETASEEAKAAIDGLSGYYAQELQVELQTAMGRAIEAEAGISIDTGMVNAINAQLQ